MSTVIRQAESDEIPSLYPLLLLAEPSRRALRWSLANLTDAAYRMDIDGALVAAATMLWRREPCEIMELGVEPSRQRQGLGGAFIDWLAEEARRRGQRTLAVGTSSTSASNILFYQKCGFRVADIRRDYFWYYDEPLVENGLPVRDMIVFDKEL